MPKPIPEAQRKELLARFAAGETVTNLARSLGRDPTTVRGNLRNWGADIPAGPTPRRYTAGQKKQAVDMYAAGATVLEVATKFGVTFSTMRECLVKWGYAGRRTGPRRRLSLTENYFENIDQPDKAYWLGFLYADGSLQATKNNMDNPTGVRLALMADDAPHIQKWLNAVDSSTRVTYSIQESGFKPGSRYAYAVVSCARMCDDLTAKGVVLRKTHNPVDPLPHVPEYLQHHFMRGFYDGDGWMSHGRYGASQEYSAVFGLCVPSPLISQFSDWFVQRYQISHPSVVSGLSPDVIVTIRWCGGQIVEHILNHLYEGSTPDTRLDRKYDNYLRLLNRQLQQPGRKLTVCR